MSACTPDGLRNWKPETSNKKDREQKRFKAKQQKEVKKKERQRNSLNGNDLDKMMAYVDEFGTISSSPPDGRNKKEVKVEDIEISVAKKQLIDSEDVPGKGVVDFFNGEKGYGFIKDYKTQQRFFAHVSNCKSQIQIRDEVIFDVEFGPKGPIAVNVQLAEKTPD